MVYYPHLRRLDTKSNHMYGQMSLQRQHFLLLESWSCLGLKPPAWWTGAYPIELTMWHCKIQPASKLSGALWQRGGKTKESLQLRLWNLNISSEKRPYPLSTCFSMFVYICTCFCFALIGGNLTAQSTGSATGGLEVEIKFLFLTPLPENTGELACEVVFICNIE